MNQFTIALLAVVCLHCANSLPAAKREEALDMYSNSRVAREATGCPDASWMKYKSEMACWKIIQVNGQPTADSADNKCLRDHASNTYAFYSAGEVNYLSRSSATDSKGFPNPTVRNALLASKLRGFYIFCRLPL